jgi:hypothetical protein
MMLSINEEFFVTFLMITLRKLAMKTLRTFKPMKNRNDVIVWF